MEVVATMRGTIRIQRERNSFAVHVDDPEIVKQNESKGGEWKNPCLEYSFDTKEEVIAFVEKVFDKALPTEDFSTAFDREAKEAKKDD